MAVPRSGRVRASSALRARSARSSARNRKPVAPSSMSSLWPPDELKWPLSAADVFVLSTRNEGWANVILEAMACGLPVVASDVGGNSEVVCRPELGEIVPFDDQAALTRALDRSLAQGWDRQTILKYARDNDWDKRVHDLTLLFHALSRGPLNSVAPA